MKLRYAFDIGTNSIGWAVYRLDGPSPHPVELIDCGARLFSDGRNPKDGQSLAVMRRAPRSARKRRDRFVQRRDWLLTLMVRHGLMPREAEQRKALETLDPYALRARALDERLEPHEIGRALFHLNQRRGFKSNRIADGSGDDKETGKIASGAARLEEELAAENCRTVGEFYARRQSGPVRQREAVRIRIEGEGAKSLYAFYPMRELAEAEFDQLWEAQAGHHPLLLTGEARDAIRRTMFHQRPLKKPPIGRCTFIPTETRLATADPLAQAFRVYQELANLKLEEAVGRSRSLTVDERDRLAGPLLAGEDLTFGKMRKLLDLSGAAKINLEEGGRDRLKGDATAARLGGKKGKLARLWPDLSAARRAEVIDRLLSEPEIEALKAWLILEVGATPEEAADAASFRPPDGHIRLGPTAAGRVVEELKRDVITYAEACRRAGFHHSDERDGVIHDRLPDYREVLERHTIGGTGDPCDPPGKRLGRIGNPTVHIGLNQLRRVVNRLIEAHGPPEQIVLELARDLKQTREDKERAQKDNKKYEEANRQRTDQLAEFGVSAGPADLRRMRLWEELGVMPRRCVYTGRAIGLAELFSGEVEIEHILPFSRTLDDSMANKTLAFRDANRGKRNQSPEEAFSGAEYEAIQQRADTLPPNKRWRFKPGAMERFETSERDFLARQLNETRYLSRLAKAYVTGVATDPNGVWVVTGQLTALLRARWGLNNVLSDANRKLRTDHRHHAIDAAAIGVIDRGLLNELARRAGVREDGDDLDHITKDVPEPYTGFFDNVRDRISAVIVSHKPEHGLGGALHEDTAYGIVEGPDKAEGDLVFRKAIDDLSPNEIDKVRDLDLRAKLQAVRDAAGGSAKALRTALSEFGRANGVRRVRILKMEKGFVPISDRRTQHIYKALIPGENHHMDIVEGPDGVWRGYAATVFDVNRKDFRPTWINDLPGARLIMRLHKADLVEVGDTDGQRRIKRVVRIEPSAKRIRLAAHNEGGALQLRHETDRDIDPFEWDFAYIAKLRDRGCRAILVNEIGKINPQM
jgi:CRISPR-associated endonuclease Csn1